MSKTTRTTSSEKVKLTNIKVPVELRDRIEKLTKKLGERSYWRTILRAIELLETTIRRPKEKKQLPRLDKCSWYIYKFVRSVSEFILDPSDEKFSLLKERIEELKERVFGGENEYLDLLMKVAKDYKSSKGKNALIEINETAKMIISEIIVKFLFEEEEEGTETE